MNVFHYANDELDAWTTSVLRLASRDVVDLRSAGAMKFQIDSVYETICRSPIALDERPHRGLKIVVQRDVGLLAFYSNVLVAWQPLKQCSRNNPVELTIHFQSSLQGIPQFCTHPCSNGGDRDRMLGNAGLFAESTSS